LDSITSLSPIYALSIATFYFTGSYYHLSKRLWRLRYVFTKKIDDNEQRIGYEVLGEIEGRNAQRINWRQGCDGIQVFKEILLDAQFRKAHAATKVPQQARAQHCPHTVTSGEASWPAPQAPILNYPD
jgi:hypothetical protein